MKIISGDIWRISKPLDYIVIPTCIGWTLDGLATMHTAIGRQAAKRYPQLRIMYGEYCMQHRENTPVIPYRPRAANSRNLVLFPITPIAIEHPNLSWVARPSTDRITKSMEQLKVIADGMIGCRFYAPSVIMSSVRNPNERAALIALLEQCSSITVVKHTQSLY